jgi:hypothetical protein
VTWVEWLLLLVQCFAWAAFGGLFLAYGIEKGWIPEKPHNDCDP